MTGPDADASRVNLVHHLLRARDYQDRPEYDRLCDWWRERPRGVCALVGIGGAGKTAIVERFLRAMPGSTLDDPNVEKVRESSSKRSMGHLGRAAKVGALLW